MKRIILSRALLAAFLLLTVALVSGCRVVEEDGSSPPPSVPGAYTVNPLFREFYRLLGGEPTLGLAISPLVESGSLQIQYTEKTLMRYDPSAAPSEQYSLAPLGLETGAVDNPLPLPEQDVTRIISGYILYSEFVPLYDTLQGSRFAGRPLTQPRLNSEFSRIEQYFENVGFYRGLDEPAGQAHLLDYGSHKCGLACRSRRATASRVGALTGPPQIFLETIARTGSDLFGAPLSPPYLAADGQIEQVYAGAVLAADPAAISAPHLRPAAKMSGLPTNPPAAKIDDPRMVFYPVEGVLGYNIPAVFQDYINRHGGMDLAGLPVSELFPEGNLYRQCFENYCLDFDSAANENSRIRPALVGAAYIQRFPPPAEPLPQTPIQAGSPLLTVSEAFPLLPPGQVQKINLQTLDSGSQSPLPNLTAALTLSMPDGTLLEYTFPPTGPDGRSTLELPLFSADPGTLFLYQVCLTPAESVPQCVDDSYLIWKN